MDELTKAVETLEETGAVEVAEKVAEVASEAVKNLTVDDVKEIASSIAKKESLKVVAGITAITAIGAGIKKIYDVATTSTEERKIKKAEKLEKKAAKLREKAEKKKAKAAEEKEENVQEKKDTKK